MYSIRNTVYRSDSFTSLKSAPSVTPPTHALEPLSPRLQPAEVITIIRATCDVMTSCFLPSFLPPFFPSLHSLENMFRVVSSSSLGIMAWREQREIEDGRTDGRTEMALGSSKWKKQRGKRKSVSLPSSSFFLSSTNAQPELILSLSGI